MTKLFCPTCITPLRRNGTRIDVIKVIAGNQLVEAIPVAAYSCKTCNHSILQEQPSGTVVSRTAVEHFITTKPMKEASNG